jgi:hypothetical protein
MRLEHWYWQPLFWPELERYKSGMYTDNGNLRTKDSRKWAIRFWAAKDAADVNREALVEMQESNTITRDALQVVQRPFISFSPQMTLGTKMDKNRIIAFYPQVPISNSGSTPTKNMRDNVSVYPSKEEIPQNFPFQDTGAAQSTDVGAHGTTTYFTTNAIAIGDVQAVQSHQGHVSVYGWATYNDWFRNTTQHITKFCYELRVDPGVDISDPRWIGNSSYNVGSFGMCPAVVGHNCADEKCDKEN